MPTPSDDTLPLSPPVEAHPQRSSHPSCPPDPERIPLWRSQDHCVVEDAITDAVAAAMANTPQNLSPSSPAADIGSREIEASQQVPTKTMAGEEGTSAIDSMTPESTATEVKDNESHMSNTPFTPGPQTISGSTSSSSTRYEFSNVRVCVRNFLLTIF